MSLYLQTLYSHAPPRHNVGDCSTYFPHHWNLKSRVNGNYVIEGLWISLVSLKEWGVARHEAGRLAYYTGSWWLQIPTARPNQQHLCGDAGHVSLNKLLEQKLNPDKENKCFWARYFITDIQTIILSNSVIWTLKNETSNLSGFLGICEILARICITLSVSWVLLLEFCFPENCVNALSPFMR